MELVTGIIGGPQKALLWGVRENLTMGRRLLERGTSSFSSHPIRFLPVSFMGIYLVRTVMGTTFIMT